MEREVLAVRKRVLGAEHPDTLTAAGNLASFLLRQRKHAESEKMHREVLAVMQRLLGAEHPRTLTSAQNLASSLLRQGKQDEGVAMLREVLEHPSTDMHRQMDELVVCMRVGVLALLVFFLSGARFCVCGATRIGYILLLI